MHIKLPYSQQSGHIPASDRLKVGELWINGADKILGTKNEQNEIVQFAQFSPAERDKLLNGQDYIPKAGVVEGVTVGQTATKPTGTTIEINNDSDTAIEYTVTSSNLTINVGKTTGHKATKLVISKPADQAVSINWVGVDHWLSTTDVPEFGDSIDPQELCVAIFTSSTINCVNVVYNTESPNVGSEGVWGSISGSISDQEDLQAALDSKLNVDVASSMYLPINGKAASALTADSVAGSNVTGAVALATQATTANTLTSNRTFSITGGATSAAVNFNGSGNVALNVTEINGAAVTGTVSNAQNAVQATKASQDGQGRTISTTYAIKSDTYTKAEVDSKISSVYKYQGSVATEGDLPSTNQVIGDVWNVEESDKNFAWDGTRWDPIGGTIDLSAYSTTEQADAKYLGIKSKAVSATTADKATTLANTRTLSLSGDATGSQTFNGAANADIKVTLSSTGVIAGSYGPETNTTLQFGDSFVVPYVTVDSKGRVEGAQQVTITIPEAPTTVTGNAGTATKLQTARTIALSGAVTGTATSFDGSVDITIATTAVDGTTVTGVVPEATKATQDKNGNDITTQYIAKSVYDAKVTELTELITDLQTRLATVEANYATKTNPIFSGVLTIQ